jgi:hypothetical protein
LVELTRSVYFAQARHKLMYLVTSMNARASGRV